MRLIQLRLGYSEGGSNRWANLLHDSHPFSPGVLFVHNGVCFGPRLGADEQARRHMLSDTLCPWNAACLGGENLCRRLPRRNPLQEGFEPVVLGAGRQLAATTPIFESRLVGETLKDRVLFDKRVGCRVGVIDTGPLQIASWTMLLIRHVVCSRPPTRSSSFPPASAVTCMGTELEDDLCGFHHHLPSGPLAPVHTHTRMPHTVSSTHTHMHI